MNILFISPYVPNLIRVRPYNFIRHLAKRGNQVTLITLWSEPDEKRDIAEMRQYCKQVYAYELTKVRSYSNCVKTLFTADPLQSVYCWHPEAAKEIVTQIQSEKYDVIHIEHMRGARYGLELVNGKKYHRPPIVWDSVDNISHLFRQASRQSQKKTSRLITSFELRRTEAYEKMLVSRFNHVLVTSSTDREAFLSLAEDKRLWKQISVLNNGVDLVYFSPDESVTRDDHTVVVSGKLSYHANINMVLFLVNQIMPQVWLNNPEVRLDIVGKDPPREIIELGKNPKITVTGTVMDLRPYLRQAAVAVAPIIYGAGIQNKVLEAMACATPVISTSKAVSALAVTHGENVLVADTPQEFAQAIVDLLADPQKRDRIGSAGRQFVEKYHNWSTITEQLEVIYNCVLGEHLAV